MSNEEQAFVRMYARALIRDGDVLMTAAHLMTDASLAVSDFYSAVQLANAAELITENFALAVDAPPDQSGPFRWTPNEQKHVINLFQRSFFNLLAGEKHSAVDAGWFSGTPDDWVAVIKAIDKFYVEKKEQYEKPTTKRKRKHAAAVRRWKKKLSDERLPKKMY